MLPAETCGAISPPSAVRSIGFSEMGLINDQGRDAFCRRVIFPCRQHGQIVNLYGRSIGAAFPHRLLPRSKGGLFAWESVSQLLHRDPGRRAVRSGRPVAGRFSQHHLRHRHPSDASSVRAACRSAGPVWSTSSSIRMKTKPANRHLSNSRLAWQRPAFSAHIVQLPAWA